VSSKPGAGQFNELGRKYNFKNLAGPGSATRIDLRCRLDIVQVPTHRSLFRSSPAKKHVAPFVYLVVDPYLLEQTKFASAIFGPSEDLLNSKVLTAKIEAAATGVNFIVFDQSDGDHLVQMLMRGRPLTLKLLLVPTAECIANIPLYNDFSFQAEYELFKSALLAQ